MSQIDHIAERLEAIVADLDEIAFDRLRESMSDGATERPSEDKELVKARRAVEKAAHILRSLGE